MKTLRHSYRGELRITGYDAGLALVETTDIDSYLSGIAEVPFSWHEEALKAQVIAARTYLAWTLSGGRSSTGRKYDYDICATAACQVYAGVGLVEGSNGERWGDAVTATADLILVHEGRPAQALYSSTMGSRTRNVEDVFVGSGPIPYLVGVECPNEDSPFVHWEVYVTGEQMEKIARQAGLIEGRLLGVSTETTPDGGGPWTVTFRSDTTETIPTWTLRGKFNSAASKLFPNDFPSYRAPDKRYPTTVLSPTYVIEELDRWHLPPAGGPPVRHSDYLIVGEGWGHSVGMSQYGAQAMALEGYEATAILNHFYTGLWPVPGADLLPESVEVGLAVEANRIVIEPDGPVTVIADGRTVASSELGIWTFESFDGQTRVIPPAGIGLPPRIDGPVWADDGTLLINCRTAAIITVVVRVNGEEVNRLEPRLYQAGIAGWTQEGLGYSAGTKDEVAIDIWAETSKGQIKVGWRRLPLWE